MSAVATSATQSHGASMSRIPRSKFSGEAAPSPAPPSPPAAAPPSGAPGDCGEAAGDCGEAAGAPGAAGRMTSRAALADRSPVTSVHHGGPSPKNISTFARAIAAYPGRRSNDSSSPHGTNDRRHQDD